MVTVGLLARLEAKPGKEQELASFLVWFALQLTANTFGIFDAFVDEAGRAAHLSGQIAAALGQRAGELLASPPVIERVDVLAAKLASPSIE